MSSTFYVPDGGSFVSSQLTRGPWDSDSQHAGPPGALHRLPATEWVRLDAVTVPERTGIGMSDATLHDERGPIGRALQTLLVRERS